MKRPAILKKTVEAKILSGDHQLKVAGCKCMVERNGGNLGEFLLWFGKRCYARVDAKDLLDTISYVDGKVSL